MNQINWKVRIKNKAFWVALIPAIILLIQAICAVGGKRLDLDELGQRLLAVVEAVFIVLAILGVVNDPTTPTLNDSEIAKTYPKPGEITPETINQLEKMIDNNTSTRMQRNAADRRKQK